MNVRGANVQVAADEKDVMKELEAEDYHTQTRGERHVEPARLYVFALSPQSAPNTLTKEHIGCCTVPGKASTA